MKFSLIICTYKRPKALINLLNSINAHIYYPDEILIIDSSPLNETERALLSKKFHNLKYFHVGVENQGLTKQRNFGLHRISDSSEIVCFLDDDIVLTDNYFQELLRTYEDYPDAAGVGGYILEDIAWTKKLAADKYEFAMDGWVRRLGSRNVLRDKLGLLSDQPPGFMPEFSNGFSIGFLPPSNKIYPVEFFMGGVSSYRKELFEKINFSSYFEGYGLYEDMDFCLRASRISQLYVNTNARLHHYHEESGRPNQFNYGKMVVRNGWYVWRIKYPNPSLEAQLKWHLIILTLTLIRFGNSITTREKMKAFKEGLGRTAGWLSLMWNRPKVQR